MSYTNCQNLSNGKKLQSLMMAVGFTDSPFTFPFLLTDEPLTSKINYFHSNPCLRHMPKMTFNLIGVGIFAISAQFLGPNYKQFC